MKKKVLITGGAGFIGLHLATKLYLEGYDVTLVDNFSRAINDKFLSEILEKDSVHFYDIDLLDIESIQILENDFDFIFHLAAIIGVTHVMDRPYNVLYDNIRMLANIVDLAHRQKSLSKFLFASTSEVYAGTLKNFNMTIPTPESTPIALTKLSHPRTSYMLSKLYGEAMCQQSNLPFTIFRPHNLYGPRMGMSHVIPEQLKKAYNLSNGDNVEVFSPKHTRAFCYIDDAVEMLFRMMTRVECKKKTLNLGSQDSEITIAQLATICYEIVGKNLTIIPQEDNHGSPARRQPDMKLTQVLTGFQSKISLHAGITKTYQWYKENILDGDSISAK
jgi:UDP-glucose 4-epimerase